jgi:hypothetical protein
MKLLSTFTLAIFCLLGFASSTSAQNWTVGQPVNRTIIDYPSNIFVTAMCDTMSGQEAEFVIALPPVTGVSYYAHVDYATSANHTYKLRQGSNVQIVQSGDSMLMQSTAAFDTLHLGYAGYESEVSIRFKAYGTPTTSGENHPCGSTNDGWYNQPIGCLFRNWPDALTYDTTCTVQASTALSPTAEAGIRAYPNPATDIFAAYFDDETVSTLTLTNLCGQTLLVSPISDAQSVKLDVRHLARGLYFLQAQKADGSFLPPLRISLN